MQYRGRGLFRDRQLRSFLPRTDRFWMDICHFDSRTVGAGGDELHRIKEKQIRIWKKVTFVELGIVVAVIYVIAIGIYASLKNKKKR